MFPTRSSSWTSPNISNFPWDATVYKIVFLDDMNVPGSKIWELWMMDDDLLEILTWITAKTNQNVQKMRTNIPTVFHWNWFIFNTLQNILQLTIFLKRWTKNPSDGTKWKKRRKETVAIAKRAQYRSSKTIGTRTQPPNHIFTSGALFLFLSIVKSMNRIASKSKSGPTRHILHRASLFDLKYGWRRVTQFFFWYDWSDSRGKTFDLKQWKLCNNMHVFLISLSNR